MSESPQRSPEEPAHDILAAEAFAVPAPDPELRQELELPGDPAGIAEPHDILAAEEFAMPAPEARAGSGLGVPASRRRLAARAGLAVAGLLTLWLRRRR